MIEKNFIGFDGFIWWIGIVENRQDPMFLGRCQVRIFGLHSASLSELPVENLPWAIPANSLNNHSFATPKETDVVFGFFADGSNAQTPVMLGIIPGYETNAKNTGEGFHDPRSLDTIKLAPKTVVNRTYNNDGTGIKLTEANTANNEVLETLRYPREDDLNKNVITGITRQELKANNVISARRENRDLNVVTAEEFQWDEPYPAYNPLYPYNQAIETESGHTFEMDDTPKNERISMHHRSGTYWEMFPSGTKVEKITKSNYQIVMADDYIHIMGRAYITVDSDALVKVLGDARIEVGNDVSMKVSGSMNLNVREGLNIKASELNIDVGGEVAVVSGGDQFLTSAGDVNVKGKSSIKMSTAGDLSLGAEGNLNADGSKVYVNSGKSKTAKAGKPKGIGDVPVRSTKNNPVSTGEKVPIPQAGVQLDSVTGTAVKEDGFLDTKPDGEKEEPPAPPPQECNYNPNGKSFINKSSWKIGSKGLDLIKRSEGYEKTIGGGKVRGYPDPATNGEPITIGYGTTGPAVDKKITLDSVIDQSTAEEYLAYSINKKFLPSLKRYVNVDLTQEMVDACLSLMYNIGAGNFGKSTLVKKINQKDWCGAADQFLVWNKAAGKVLKGLTTRRQAERSLFLS